ncbi:putative paraquat-inducible protein A [Pseudomonas frederiksbergensis]
MRAIDAGILICAECHELNKQEAGTDEQVCTRCGALVHARRPNSLMRTWALLVTAAIIYIPANVLPIMTVSSLGQGDPSTIMSGVIQLVQHGMIPIAAVVFIASILVPTFKLVGIGLLLFSVQRRQPLSRTPTYMDVPLYRVHRPLVDARYFCDRYPSGGCEFRTASQRRSQPWRHRLRQCGDSDDACRGNFRSPTDLG